MRTQLMLVTVIVTTFVTTLGVSSAPAQGRDRAREAQVETRLARRSAAAVKVFRRATAAMDAQQTLVAERGYRDVLALAPDFAPALRRLSYLVADPDEALRLARRARAVEDEPENLEAVLRALLRPRSTTDSARQEAATLAAQLIDRAPNDKLAQVMVAQAALAGRDQPLLARAVSNLRRLDPQGPLTHFFAGLAAAGANDALTAERELQVARQLGMPAGDVDPLLARLHDPARAAESSARRWGLVTLTLYAALGWAAGLVLLLVVGLILSRLTLVTVGRASPEATGAPSGAMRTMRKIYAVVLVLTSIYFYLSIPFVLLMVLAAGGGLIYLFFAIGRIPIKLVAVIVVVVFVTLWAMLKSLFIRRRDEDPGELLPEERAPRLWAMLREVAARVGTRPVDAVYVVPDTAVAVFERGSFLKRLTGRSQRVLILGLGVLEGMTQTQLKAILAHEYGHFSNKDTAGGDLALHVRRAIFGSAEAMARGGAAAWYNPAWLFLNGFYRIYLRVSQGASRLQEVLADRWAALCYGARAFVDGLRHVVRRSIEFDALANHEVEWALRAQRPLRNLYALRAAPLGGASNEHQLQAVVDAVGDEAKRSSEPSESSELSESSQPSQPSEPSEPRAAAEGQAMIETANSAAEPRAAAEDQAMIETANSAAEPRAAAEDQAIETPPAVTLADIDEALRAALEEKGSAYDSHPAPAQRIAWVERLQHAEVVDDGAAAWDLLEDRDALQAQMTELVNGRVQLALVMQSVAPTGFTE